MPPMIDIQGLGVTGDSESDGAMAAALMSRVDALAREVDARGWFEHCGYVLR